MYLILGILTVVLGFAANLAEAADAKSEHIAADILDCRGDSDYVVQTKMGFHIRIPATYTYFESNNRYQLERRVRAGWDTEVPFIEAIISIGPTNHPLLSDWHKIEVAHSLGQSTEIRQLITRDERLDVTFWQFAIHDNENAVYVTTTHEIGIEDILECVM